MLDVWNTEASPESRKTRHGNRDSPPRIQQKRKHESSIPHQRQETEDGLPEQVNQTDTSFLFCPSYSSLLLALSAATTFLLPHIARCSNVQDSEFLMPVLIYLLPRRGSKFGLASALTNCFVIRHQIATATSESER